MFGLTQVNALLSLSEGAVFSSSNQPFVAEKMRLGAYGATSLIVKITALKEGLKNLTGNHVENVHPQSTVVNNYMFYCVQTYFFTEKKDERIQFFNSMKFIEPGTKFMGKFN